MAERSFVEHRAAARMAGVAPRLARLVAFAPRRAAPSPPSPRRADMAATHAACPGGSDRGRFLGFLGFVPISPPPSGQLQAVVQKAVPSRRRRPRRRLDAVATRPRTKRAESRKISPPDPTEIGICSQVRSRAPRNLVAHVHVLGGVACGLTDGSFTISAASRSAMAAAASPSAPAAAASRTARACAPSVRAASKAAGASAPRNDSPNAPPSSSTPSRRSEALTREAGGDGISAVRRNARAIARGLRRGRARRSTPRRRRRRHADSSRDARASRPSPIHSSSFDRRRSDRRRIGAAGAGFVASPTRRAPRLALRTSPGAPRQKKRLRGEHVLRKARADEPTTARRRAAGAGRYESRRPDALARSALRARTCVERRRTTRSAVSVPSSTPPLSSEPSPRRRYARDLPFGATAATAASISPSSERRR